MFSQEINNLASIATNKKTLLQENKTGYLLASMLAGIYVGIGILLIFTIGGLLQPADIPGVKILMGVSFGVALSLVLVAGSELFTGNNLIMMVGSLRGQVSWKDSISVWIYSYIGNFFGSILLSILYVQSGLATGSIADFIINGSKAKISTGFGELFIRGILCNMLVCLAVWCFFKLKEESAKLIMIFWCLFAFITIGFEHSIANMTLITTAMMLPNGGTVSLAGIFKNLIPVTIGNFIGGAIFIGWTYCFIANGKEKVKEEKSYGDLSK
ncbi:MAG: formate/nitrite transporter family protein [Clostridiaceae bacterium]|nr:formate/nitrite transporter family protein [Clostridiaceae bacterium]MBW4858942.1 formate/nitrite transporter family protein [Clostridiaceae bacterium]MBW4869517.1 formate/nitrite transporter family protein [Clostridiaceae bacterium]